tara:strand:+ start:1374 stop:1496 length:123 start_codon:yes stop_codon:yes gene_type:complete
MQVLRYDEGQSYGAHHDANRAVGLRLLTAFLCAPLLELDP